jgi:hypothetical protein
MKQLDDMKDADELRVEKIIEHAVGELNRAGYGHTVIFTNLIMLAVSTLNSRDDPPKHPCTGFLHCRAGSECEGQS